MTVFRGQLSEYGSLVPLKLRRQGKAVFSNLYSAQDLKSGKEVIVKVLKSSLSGDEAAEERFLGEAKMELNHPSVVRYLDYGTVPRCFNVSEPVNGITLEGIQSPLFGSRKQFRKKVLTLFIELCNALTYIHQKGIIHCDVKPANLITDKNMERITLIDFGQAFRLKGINYEPPRFSMVYSPPEIILKRYSLYGPASDIYSAGISLYEVLTGSFPFRTCNSMALLNLQLNHPIPANAKIPSQLMQVIHRATYKEPFPKPPQRMKNEEMKEVLAKGISKRYTTAAEFGQDLKNCLLAV